MEKKTISVIIPVLNEEKTVAKVIRPLLDSESVSEIICVNDGSTDKSLEILKSFGNRIKLISFSRNRGKGAALAVGVKAAQGEIVVFMDSDLTGVLPKHVRVMIEPILNKETEIVFGLTEQEKPALGGRLPGGKNRYNKIDFYISGQRVYLRKALLPHFKEMAKTGYGVEFFLNRVLGTKKRKIVFLDGVLHLDKIDKWSLRLMLRKTLTALLDITRELGKKEIISPADYKRIGVLAKVKVLADVKAGIAKIRGKKLRQVLQKYLLKYLKVE